MDNNTNKYLSLAGLSTFWTKVKTYVDHIDVTIDGNVTGDDLLSITKETTAATKEGTKQIKFTVNAGNLTTKIADLKNTDDTLDAAIKAEVTRAEAAETVLTNGLAQEVKDRQADVAGLKTELVGGASKEYDTLGELETAIKAVDTKLDNAMGQGGNVAAQITDAINKLDVDDAAADGKYVSAVSETDGKIAVSRTVLPTYNVSATGAFVSVSATTLDDKGKSFAITTSNIASASDLTALTGRVKANEDAITALASATHFRGVVTSLDSVSNPAEGDVVVLNGTLGSDAFSKEYIWSGGEWIELGDTTAELQAINANKKAIEAEATTRAQADTKLETDLRQAISDAIAGDKTSVVDNSNLVDLSVDVDGKEITIADTAKLTHAVAIAETSVQKVEGTTGTYADIAVAETVNTGDDSTKSYKVAATFHTATDVENGGDKLTTAQKVKAYVEAKLNSVAHEGTTDDTSITKVVTSVTNKDNGTGFDVNFTNFIAITDAEIEGLFTTV